MKLEYVVGSVTLGCSQVKAEPAWNVHVLTTNQRSIGLPVLAFFSLATECLTFVFILSITKIKNK